MPIHPFSLEEETRVVSRSIEAMAVDVYMIADPVKAGAVNVCMDVDKVVVKR